MNGRLFNYSPIQNNIAFQVALGNLHPTDNTIIGHNHFKDFKVFLF